MKEKMTRKPLILITSRVNNKTPKITFVTIEGDKIEREKVKKEETSIGTVFYTTTPAT